MNRNKITQAIITSILTIGASSSVFAEENKGGLEIIEVTATKRVTTTQDTPMSIEAITGDELAAQNITNMEGLTERLPNVLIGESMLSTSINVRGMGSGADRSFEQSVAMFIDNVYMPRSRSYRAPFFDMERVEVLRGPQSVLFGLNATAGSVAIHTASTLPSDDSFVKLTGAYETELSGYSTEVIVGGSPTDELGLRLAARYNDDGDGWFDNTFTGEDEFSNEETLVRGTAVWEASDDLVITTKVNYADATRDGAHSQQIFDNATADFMGLVRDDEWDWTMTNDTDLAYMMHGEGPGLEHELFSFSMNATYDFDGYTLTTNLSNSASDFVHRSSTGGLAFDPDAALILGGAVPGIYGDYAGDLMTNGITEEYEQTALEVRLSSPVDQTFSYIVGAYIDSGELVNELTGGVNFLLGAVDGFGTYTKARSNQTQDTDTMSVFFSGTYSINEEFRLILGGRYITQDKDYARANGNCESFAYDLATNDMNLIRVIPENTPDGSYGATPLCGTYNGLKTDRTSDNFMPELVAQWDMNEDTVVYAKVGKSIKAGGFNFSSTAPEDVPLEFDDETALGFELGYKARLLDGNAELNITLFHTKFEDLQLQSWVTPPNSAPVGIIGNAGDSESQGIEIEFNMAVTDWLTAGISVASLSSEYTSFVEGPCHPTATPNVAPLTGCDLTGKTTPMAPEYSGNVYAEIFTSVGDDLYLTGGVDVNFSDSYFTDGPLNPAGQQDSYSKVNARIGITNDENWTVSLIGRNLTEETTIAYSTPFIGTLGYAQAPRTITLQASYTF